MVITESRVHISRCSLGADTLRESRSMLRRYAIEKPLQSAMCNVRPIRDEARPTNGTAKAGA
jgi:hypothetical protein